MDQIRFGQSSKSSNANSNKNTGHVSYVADKQSQEISKPVNIYDRIDVGKKHSPEDLKPLNSSKFKVKQKSQESSSPHPFQQKNTGEKDVTFLFYMNGQYGDLEQSIASAMLGLEESGSDQNVNIVAQLGRSAQRKAHPMGGFDRIDNDWSGVRRYYVTKSSNSHKQSVKSEDLEEIASRIPENPLVHYTLGDVYTSEGKLKKAKQSFQKAKELGYEKFLDQPFDPDVNKWSYEFDREIQPLRDAQADENVYTSPVAEFKGNVNMMHPHNLQDFIAWGMQKYPAKHYCLVMMGHGSAWSGSMKMSPSEMNMAIQAGVYEANNRSGRNDHLDAIIFNSCYMGNLESVDQLKDAADITIASQMSARTNIFYHWPKLIDKVKDILNSGEEFNPRKLAADFVDFYRKMGNKNATRDLMLRRSKDSYLTLVALDNKKVHKITNAWKKFVKDWRDSDVPDHEVFGEIKNSKNFPSYAYSPEMMFDYGTLRDVGSIAYNVMNNPKMPEELRRDCAEIRKALKEAIINEQHTGYGMEGSSGLTLWAPTNAADISLMKNAYRDRVPSFVQETGWGNKLEETLKDVDGRKLSEFLQTIQMLGRVNKMFEAPELSPAEKKNLQHKAELLEKEAIQIKKELDLSRPSSYNQNIVELVGNEDQPITQGFISEDTGKYCDPKGSSKSFEMEQLKKDIPLPDSESERKKLQDDMVDRIIKDSDKTNGMGSTDPETTVPRGAKLDLK